MDDLDALFDQPEAETQDKGGQASGGLEKPAETPSQGDGSAEEKGDEESQASTEGDGTANPDKQASEAGKEKQKGVLPKELEPYRYLIESRKLDLSKPEGVAKLAQSYKELEQHASKTTTLSKNSQDKAARVAAIATGSIEDLNKWRKSQGLPEFKTDTRSHEDREKETTELFDHMDKALKGEADSLKWLNSHFNKQFRDLDVQKALAQQNPGKSADQAFAERKRIGQTNFASAVSSNKEAKAYFDELTDHLSPGGVFDSMGIDVLDAASTPERLAAFVELGQAMHIMKNLDKIVEGKVNAELERRRTAQNAGGGKGGAKPKAQNNGSATDADLTHFFA